MHSVASALAGGCIDNLAVVAVLTAVFVVVAALVVVAHNQASAFRWR